MDYSGGFGALNADYATTVFRVTQAIAPGASTTQTLGMTWNPSAADLDNETTPITITHPQVPAGWTMSSTSATSVIPLPY